MVTELVTIMVTPGFSFYFQIEPINLDKQKIHTQILKTYVPRLCHDSSSLQPNP